MAEANESPAHRVITLCGAREQSGESIPTGCKQEELADVPPHDLRLQNSEHALGTPGGCLNDEVFVEHEEHPARLGRSVARGLEQEPEPACRAYPRKRRRAVATL